MDTSVLHILMKTLLAVVINFMECVHVIVHRAFGTIGVARGGQGRAFALPSLNFALSSKPSSYSNINCT